MAAPIAIPDRRRSEERQNGGDRDELVRNLSFLSGPHIITVQSLRSRAAGPPTPDGARRATGAEVTVQPPSPPRRAAAAAAGGEADVEAPLLAPAAPPSAPFELPVAGGEDYTRLRRRIAFAQGLSWVVNIALLVAKVYAFVLSGSKAVMASAADSAVDLVSQMVISYTDWQMTRADPRFPVGQARLEALGVLGCASVMAVASFEVVAQSGEALWSGFAQGEPPQLDLGLTLYVVLGAAILLKAVCYAVCVVLQDKSDSMLALAEDHLNDIASNLGAVGAAAATAALPEAWWIDPVSAMLISAWIMWRWYSIAVTQVHKLVGRGAPAEFVEQLKELADAHHENLALDCIRAYHFGSRYLVEMEVVLPADWSLRQSHDVALLLQHKVEALEDVERAFVHTDYERRCEPEHKVERTLGLGGSGGGGSGVFISAAVTPATTPEPAVA
ncbi:cation diffusion facilitator [Raphidocelis subcapitata]|uniref:Cation diffusion facilitator n=1 Tax=Raphidocelis subcapitata TaxID=307507 RepID=A0A2V0PIX3_9CHLO|nr:cation diffusion facilitator [Raphidocelis subcapitata]|eukprot:GBF97913.1 cation diffusion facilitator [Raphidocelis subcapitata]